MKDSSDSSDDSSDDDSDSDSDDSSDGDDTDSKCSVLFFKCWSAGLKDHY